MRGIPTITNANYISDMKDRNYMQPVTLHTELPVAFCVITLSDSNRTRRHSKWTRKLYKLQHDDSSNLI